MGLDIGQVTIGYSKQGAQNYLQKIRTEAIEQTQAILRTRTDVTSVLEECWQGQAELTFEKNIDKACDAAIKVLDELYSLIKIEFDNLHNSWVSQDDEMVQEEDFDFS